MFNIVLSYSNLCVLQLLILPFFYRFDCPKLQRSFSDKPVLLPSGPPSLFGSHCDAAPARLTCLRLNNRTCHCLISCLSTHCLLSHSFASLLYGQLSSYHLCWPSYPSRPSWQKTGPQCGILYERCRPMLPTPHVRVCDPIRTVPPHVHVIVCLFCGCMHVSLHACMECVVCLFAVACTCARVPMMCVMYVSVCLLTMSSVSMLAARVRARQAKSPRFRR